jgi:glycosyltransferase involved in cell wall biosynthesis
MKHDSYYSKFFCRHMAGNGKSFLLSKNSKVSLPLNVSSAIEVEVYGSTKVGDGKFSVVFETSAGKEVFDVRFSSRSISKKVIIFENISADLVKTVSIAKKYNTSGKVDVSRIIVSSKEEEFIKIPKKIDVGIVIPYSIYGGGEIYIKDIISSKNFESYNFHIFYLKKNKLESKFNDSKNIKHYNVKNLNDISEIIKDNSISAIIFYNSYKVYTSLKSIQKNLGFKLIEIYHSDFSWADSMYKKKDHDVDCLVKISEDVGNHISAKRVEICRVPIDTKKFSPSNGNFERKTFGIKSNSVGVISRISKEKNLEYILNLSEEMRETTFYILGDGVGRIALEREINARGINNVKIMGWISDVSKIINAFSAVVLPSKKEGTPISILESMSCNIPSFCYKSGGIPFLLKNGAFELSLEPSIDSFNILEEMNSPVYSRRFVVENFSAEKTSENFEKILNSIFMLDSEPIDDKAITIGGFYV